MSPLSHILHITVVKSSLYSHGILLGLPNVLKFGKSTAGFSQSCFDDCLGSLISKDNGAQKDIKERLGKARYAFAKLHNIWNAKQYNLKTKLRLYNSNVKSILLYGSECWRVVKGTWQRPTPSTMDV